MINTRAGQRRGSQWLWRDVCVTHDTGIHDKTCSRTSGPTQTHLLLRTCPRRRMCTWTILSAQNRAVRVAYEHIRVRKGDMKRGPLPGDLLLLALSLCLPLSHPHYLSCSVHTRKCTHARINVHLSHAHMTYTHVSHMHIRHVPVQNISHICMYTYMYMSDIVAYTRRCVACM